MERVLQGERYRRIAAPRDHVWAITVDDHSVQYRTRQGLASQPVANFRRMFVHDPKRARRK